VLCINAARAVKGHKGGYYAELNISAIKKTDTMTTTLIADRTRVDIRRL
jgi:hypothetical protein